MRPPPGTTTLFGVDAVTNLERTKPKNYVDFLFFRLHKSYDKSGCNLWSSQANGRRDIYSRLSDVLI